MTSRNGDDPREAFKVAYRANRMGEETQLTDKDYEAFRTMGVDQDGNPTFKDPINALDAIQEKLVSGKRDLKISTARRDQILNKIKDFDMTSNYVLVGTDSKGFYPPEIISGDSFYSDYITDMLRMGVGSFDGLVEFLRQRKRLDIKHREREMESMQETLRESKARETELVRIHLDTGFGEGVNYSQSIVDSLAKIQNAQHDITNYIVQHNHTISGMKKDPDPPLPACATLWAQLQWERCGRPLYILERDIADAMKNTRPYENTLSELPKLPHPGMYIHIEGGDFNLFDGPIVSEGASPILGLYLTYDDPQEPEHIIFQVMSKHEEGLSFAFPMEVPADGLDPTKDGVLARRELTRMARIGKGFTFYDPLDDAIHKDDTAYWWIRAVALFAVNLLTCLNRTMVIKQKTQQRELTKWHRKKIKRNGVTPIKRYTLLYIDPNARATIQRRQESHGTTGKGIQQVRHLRPGHWTHVWVLKPGDTDLADQSKVSEPTGNMLYRVLRWKAPYWAGQKTAPDVPPRLPARRVRKWEGPIL